MEAARGQTPLLGRFGTVGAREGGRDEARDFTPWFASDEGLRLCTRSRRILVLISLLSFACPSPAAAPDPLKEGPYPVGVTTTVFVDGSRTDHLTQKPRTLLTEIWYPAADRARTMPPSKFSDFVPGGITPEKDALLKRVWRKSSEELNQRYTMKSVRDAPVRAGRFPGPKILNIKEKE